MGGMAVLGPLCRFGIRVLFLCVVWPSSTGVFSLFIERKGSMQGQAKEVEGAVPTPVGLLGDTGAESMRRFRALWHFFKVNPRKQTSELWRRQYIPLIFQINNRRNFPSFLPSSLFLPSSRISLFGHFFFKHNLGRKVMFVLEKT